jgi:hypothetical protein
MAFELDTYVELDNHTLAKDLVNMQDRVDEEESQRKLNQEYIDNDPFMYVPKRDTPVLNETIGGMMERYAVMDDDIFSDDDDSVQKRPSPH